MELLSSQFEVLELTAFGKEASSLLVLHDFNGLANRFGYALAQGQDPAIAIEADYRRALESPHKISQGEAPSIAVKFFQQNNTGLVAVVESIVPVTRDSAVLLELIVTRSGERAHITLEDISGYLPQSC